MNIVAINFKPKDTVTKCNSPPTYSAFGLGKVLLVGWNERSSSGSAVDQEVTFVQAGLEPLERAPLVPVRTGGVGRGVDGNSVNVGPSSGPLFLVCLSCTSGHLLYNAALSYFLHLIYQVFI